MTDAVQWKPDVLQRDINVERQQCSFRMINGMKIVRGLDCGKLRYRGGTIEV